MRQQNPNPRSVCVSAFPRRIPVAVLISILMLASCLLLPSCSGDDEPDSTPVTYPDLYLSPGERVRINSGGNTAWTSSYPLVASVKGDSVIAGFVGETRLTSPRGSFNVKVVPRYRTFDEPLMKWGASMAQVRASMSGYRQLNSTATSLSYYGRGSVSAYVYLFENGMLSGSTMLVDYPYTDPLLAFLSERYVPVSYDVDEQIYAFTDPTNTLVVGITPRVIGSTVMLMVAYLPYASASSPSSLASGEALQQRAYMVSRELPERLTRSFPMQQPAAPRPDAAARLSSLTSRLDSAFSARAAHVQPK